MIHRLVAASIAITLAVGLFGRSSAQETTLFRPDPKPLLPLLQVLDRASLSGSLEISGDCGSARFSRFPQFPQVGQGKSDSTLTMLGEMLSIDRDLSVTQDSNGIIRIIGPEVPTDFLSVRIRHITFEDYKHNGLWSANAAMLAVLGAPEVVAFFKSNDIERPFPVEFGGHGPDEIPPPVTLSGSLDNVTVEEVLDRILDTFPGLWFYGNCIQNEKHKRHIFLRFYRFENKRNLVFDGVW